MNLSLFRPVIFLDGSGRPGQSDNNRFRKDHKRVDINVVNLAIAERNFNYLSHLVKKVDENVASRIIDVFFTCLKEEREKLADPQKASQAGKAISQLLNSLVRLSIELEGPLAKRANVVWGQIPAEQCNFYKYSMIESVLISIHAAPENVALRATESLKEVIKGLDSKPEITEKLAFGDTFKFDSLENLSKELVIFKLRDAGVLASENVSNAVIKALNELSNELCEITHFITKADCQLLSVHLLKFEQGTLDNEVDDIISELKDDNQASALYFAGMFASPERVSKIASALGEMGKIDDVAGLVRMAGNEDSRIEALKVLKLLGSSKEHRKEVLLLLVEIEVFLNSLKRQPLKITTNGVTTEITYSQRLMNEIKKAKEELGT